MCIKFDDTPGLNIPKLRSKARKLKRKNNLGIIFIDYLQLIEGETRGNREQEISGISIKLKLLAKELNIPIIALAQLSREVEKRPGGVPQLSDLRESGSIEQDADVVLMLYGESEAAIADDASKERVKYIKIAKQRDGMLVTIPLDFDRYTQRFSESMPVPYASTWKPMSDPDKFITTKKDDEL
jgi:replicative DNA helicase